MSEPLSTVQYEAAQVALSEEYPRGGPLRQNNLYEYYAKRGALTSRWVEWLRQTHAPHLNAVAFEPVYAYAYAEAHAGGLQEVEILLQELITLLDNVQRAQEGKR